MIYEFIATNRCNRQCDFCWVEKGSYIASKDDASKFIKEVKQFESYSNRQKFKISIFGGEPLLNLEAIEMIASAFSDDRRCQINISTNGDFILQNISRIQMMPNINWHVTAYDYKTEKAKYLDIAHALQNLTFS